MGLGLGLGAGIGGGAPAPVSDVNPNLFLWTEEMQQAVWAITGDVTVTPDVGEDPNEEMTADQVAFGTGGLIAQLSSVAATTGAPMSKLLTPTAALSRYSQAGTFDGTVYVVSVYVWDPAETGLGISLRLFRSGGFITGGLQDIFGDEPVLRVWGWKLETPAITDYVKREGV